MKSHYELSDLDFETQFQACELDPVLFNHEAHLRLAWLYIKLYGLDSAIQKTQTQLLNYVDFLDTRDKYNTTLTVAALRAVYHFMLKSKTKTFKEFIAEFPKLKNNFKGLMSYHYSFDIYNLKEAKANFLQPDLFPFD